MTIVTQEDERDRIISILKDALVLTESIYEHRDQMDDEHFEQTIKTVHGIEGKALSVFLCEGEDALNECLPLPLRIKFYEDSAHEIFRIQRLINEIEGRENEIF
jgi:hypothetical protein